MNIWIFIIDKYYIGFVLISVKKKQDIITSVMIQSK